MGDWTSIAFGSIYYALDRLAEDGFIKKDAIEQEGGRPARHIYRITRAGKAEFLRLLRKLWQEDEHQTFDFDIAIFFLQALPRPEAMTYLRQRTTRLRAALEHLDAHRGEQLEDPHVPPIANAIFEHSRVHTEAELAWTEGLLDRLTQGLFGMQ